MDSKEETEASNPAPKLSKFRELKLKIPSLKTKSLQTHTPTPRVLDFLKARPSRNWFRKLRLTSPLAVFRKTVNKREQVSLSVPSPAGIRRRFHIRFFRRINWSSILTMCREWLCHPMNIALVFWLLCVAVSGLFLGLLFLGVLNATFPSEQVRNYWIEICNQVLNALFTMMSIYQHPIIFYHLYMLLRWSSDDVTEIRKIYCKNAAYRPREWAHIMLVVILLHVTCLAQYVLCGLYWGYAESDRPEFPETVFFALGIIAPVFAGAYTVYSPLGREYAIDSAGEYFDTMQSLKTGLDFYDQRVVVSQPEWVGGLMDCGDDVTVGWLSFFCTCCVFGWNMERLGFGNMYLHLFTFLLLCVTPFLIFSNTAMNIHNVMIDEVMWYAGVVLCLCGLMYGGFWRIEMRKRFGLPESRWCCGSASLTDYFVWMFCWGCALAQEVRTGNFYDVEDDSLYRRIGQSDDDENSHEEGSGNDGDRGYEIVIDVEDEGNANDALVAPARQVLMDDCGSEMFLSCSSENEAGVSSDEDDRTTPLPLSVCIDDGSGGGDGKVPLLKEMEESTSKMAKRRRSSGNDITAACNKLGMTGPGCSIINPLIMVGSKD